ncbi:cilia- and flagella-associated protein 100-like isoform X2 [Tubulanus polymorphus]|uniref:cilia- and flagella-associated protein 100-like isoform X2 n=1 Tax=Tubulanus polymorphus TaxID=672921 RepID=UPI003DA4B105
MATERTNPFSQPNLDDILQFNAQLRQERKEERKALNKQPIHLKPTFASRNRTRNAAILQLLDSDDNSAKDASSSSSSSSGVSITRVDDDKNNDDDDDDVKPCQIDRDFALDASSKWRLEREHIDEYINRKREMFLLEYQLGVKREEMRKLGGLSAVNERKLEQQEADLQNDAALFDEMLKENDRASMDALRSAESERIHRFDKLMEVRSLKNELQRLKGQNSHLELTLNEYRMYKHFLYQLSPLSWRKERELDRERRRAARASQRVVDRSFSLPVTNIKMERANQHRLTGLRRSKRGANVAKTKAVGLFSRQGNPLGIKAKGNTNSMIRLNSIAGCKANDDDDSDDPELELYFTDPKQILDIISELEEKDLKLITNCQTKEEELEDIRLHSSRVKTKMESEIQSLKEQIDKYNAAIEENKLWKHGNQTKMRFCVYLYEGKLILGNTRRKSLRKWKCIHLPSGKFTKNVSAIWMRTLTQSRCLVIWKER